MLKYLFIDIKYISSYNKLLAEFCEEFFYFYKKGGAFFGEEKGKFNRIS